ncbi:MAG: four-carbon acid sugar kinase family protein [Hespellia sp.]|nr:four-carbon acid sugar kinase family protein [Hespellia sp.]
MPQCIVVADDLTGANATGVLLKKMNYKAYTVMNMERIELSTMKECDCLLYPTDSRGVEPDVAYNRVKNVTELLKADGVKVYAHRIDSTLRGNVGYETDAMLDCLGEDYIAIAASAFPSSGRVIIGGYMLVNGLPLHKTDAALDPKKPVKTSEVKAVFQEQSKYPVASIKMKEMMHGKHYLAEVITNLVKEGNRTIVFDCVTQEDMDLIADAVITSKIKFIAVDPGVFTATISRKLIVPAEKKEKNKILAVVGSVNPVTKTQMEELWLSQRTYNVFVNTKELVESAERSQAEVERVVDEVISNCPLNSICTVTGDGLYPENRIDFQFYTNRDHTDVEEISNRINLAFADITKKIFEKESAFRGLYTSGGDITVAVCRAFNTAGLTLMDEVLPLAAYGQLLKGEFDGVHIITKGGSQGGSDGINQCITYLKEKLYM